MESRALRCMKSGIRVRMTTNSCVPNPNCTDAVQDGEPRRFDVKLTHIRHARCLSVPALSPFIHGVKMRNRKLKSALLATVATLAVAAAVASFSPVAANDHDHDRDDHVVNANQLKTATPIKHLVVIFDENRSFDHYFGTYPNALNPEGEPVFEPARHTPRDINNLLSNPALLDNNPNLNPANGAGATNPFRLDRTQANTRSQSHNYTKEQQAYDGGKNDLFPLDVGRGTAGGAGAFGTTGQVMGYFDGNTVTALWNYAQNFAMSDNAYTDTFGPSTPGLLNMWAGQTNGAVFTAPAGATFFDGTSVPAVGTPAF